MRLINALSTSAAYVNARAWMPGQDSPKSAEIAPWMAVIKFE